MADVGRPTNYRPEMAEQAFELSSQGLTSKEIAEKLGIGYQSLYNYMTQYPEMMDAIKRGKATSDERIEKSLYIRAKGYTTEEITEEFNADGELTKRRVVTKKVPPDTVAQIFWLKNRKSKEWRDKHDIDGNLEVTYKVIPDTTE